MWHFKDGSRRWRRVLWQRETVDVGWPEGENGERGDISVVIGGEQSWQNILQHFKPQWKHSWKHPWIGMPILNHGNKGPYSPDFSAFPLDYYRQLEWSHTFHSAHSSQSSVRNESNAHTVKASILLLSTLQRQLEWVALDIIWVMQSALWYGACFTGTCRVKWTR